MNRTLNFFKRNIKELLRDPIIYVFGLGFPIIMLVLFYIINKWTSTQTPIFEMRSLLPGIIVFSYSFVMLILALVVSKDKQTFFLKRLYSSPMKPHNFIVGYFLIGVVIGIIQTIICVLTGLFISLISGTSFVAFSNIFLLILCEMPILITNICLGILFGTVFNEKTAPGVCAVFISIAGILGGCWMPLETMGNFATFCRFLPFYPSVYVGRILTNSTNLFGATYSFDSVATLGLISIFCYMIASIILTIVSFKKSMISE